MCSQRYSELLIAITRSIQRLMSLLERSFTCSSNNNSNSSSLGTLSGEEGDSEAVHHSVDGLHPSPLLFLFPLLSPDQALAYWPEAAVMGNGNNNIQEYQ